MRMTLLRSPRWPDPQADVGEHRFAYAIRPHAGSWQAAGVTAEARAFNAPLLLAPGHVAARSWLATDDPALLIDTVKRAEDGDALVVRLYEAYGGRGTARLRVGVPFAGARRANLLEDPLGPLELDDGAVLLPYRPFEIVTVLLD